MSDFIQQYLSKGAVNGKGNISAEVIADSMNVWGDRLITFRLHYPRYVHAEFMTHRMFSRNASSSRAIPVKKVLEQVRENPAKPVHWGKNQPGMQANEECDELVDFDTYLDKLDGPADLDVVRVWKSRDDAWEHAAKNAANVAQRMEAAGYHKQVVNRLLEPFQFMNVIVSMTDTGNWYWLRDHNDADPTIHELARVMREAQENSVPEELRQGEWHTPFVNHRRDVTTNELDYESEGKIIDLELAKQISSSCCAQVSYRKLDTSIEKACMIYDKLVGSVPLHASPFEHVATPYSEDEYMARKKAAKELDDALFPIWGQQSLDFSEAVMYCGNFKGWTQLRKMLPDENHK